MRERERERGGGGVKELHRLMFCSHRSRASPASRDKFLQEVKEKRHADNYTPCLSHTEQDTLASARGQ